MGFQKRLFRIVERDVEAGRDRRAVGCDRVIRHDRAAWRADYRAIAATYLSTLAPGTEFTGEDLRAYATDAGLGEPHHVNAWSAMFRCVLAEWTDAGHVEAAGQLRTMTRPEAHARRGQVYRRTWLNLSRRRP